MPSARILVLIFSLLAMGFGSYLLYQDHAKRNPGGSPAGPPFRMSDRIATLKVEGEGASRHFVFETKTGRRELTPDEFAAEVVRQQEKKQAGGWWFRVLDITSVQGIFWVVLGFAGQFMFTGRMLVQWIASERAKRSVVPPAFWWMSLFGSSLLIIYFWWRVDAVGILGQATGWIVYIRNLLLLKNHKRSELEEKKD